MSIYPRYKQRLELDRLPIRGGYLSHRRFLGAGYAGVEVTEFDWERI
jgi:hypothetical protein